MEALETKQGSKCSDFFAIDFLWMNCTIIINVAMWIQHLTLFYCAQIGLYSLKRNSILILSTRWFWKNPVPNAIKV